MGISQIPEQIRRAPAGALRAVFSGIGRILLAADRPSPGPARLRSDAGSTATVPSEQPVRQQRPQRSQPAAESRWRSLDLTGNVRVITAGEIEDDSPSAASEGPAASDAGLAAVPAKFLATSTAPTTAAAQLPLDDYDNLSLPSIRARLRTLSTDQLKVLADYERKNAERTDVLGMLERRIEKVESAG